MPLPQGPDNSTTGSQKRGAKRAEAWRTAERRCNTVLSRFYLGARTRSSAQVGRVVWRGGLSTVLPRRAGVGGSVLVTDWH